MNSFLFLKNLILLKNFKIEINIKMCYNKVHMVDTIFYIYLNPYYTQIQGWDVIKSILRSEKSG